jgi:hypothetical protein
MILGARIANRTPGAEPECRRRQNAFRQSSKIMNQSQSICSRDFDIVASFTPTWLVFVAAPRKSHRKRICKSQEGGGGRGPVCCAETRCDENKRANSVEAARMARAVRLNRTAETTSSIPFPFPSSGKPSRSVRSFRMAPGLLGVQRVPRRRASMPLTRQRPASIIRATPGTT